MAELAHAPAVLKARTPLTRRRGVLNVGQQVTCTMVQQVEQCRRWILLRGHVQLISDTDRVQAKDRGIRTRAV
eukprot:5383797-Lingulodinium_polyedra.AAC.1